MTNQGETNLGQRIDLSIRQARLTNEQVAERLGVTAGNISHWRNGRHRPDVEQTLRLAEVTGVSDYWLLTGREDPGELLRAFEVARARWRQLVEAGEGLADAWEQTLGQPGLLTDEQRAFLSREAGEVQDFLVSVDGRRWIELTGEQHRIVRDLVDLFGRERGGERKDVDRD